MSVVKRIHCDTCGQEEYEYNIWRDKWVSIHSDTGTLRAHICPNCIGKLIAVAQILGVYFMEESIPTALGTERRLTVSPFPIPHKWYSMPKEGGCVSCDMAKEKR